MKKKAKEPKYFLKLFKNENKTHERETLDMKFVYLYTITKMKIKILANLIY